MTSQKPAGASESIRVLVVDDYDSWRRIICKTLRRYLGCQIVGEASDGVEAVQRAREMEPDLIVLDIGLPTLNGIEAARQIRAHVPQAKILFLSEYCEVDIAEKALRSGGNGYVVKADGVDELALAVEAVLQGRQFVSASLAAIGGGLRDPSSGYRPVTDSRILPPKGHEVLFYSEDRQLLDHLTQFVGAALECGNTAIIAATEWHRDALFPNLQASGLDIAAAVAQARYVALDAAEILAAFIRNGMPDPVPFCKLVDQLIPPAVKASRAEHPRVAIFAECANLLWAEGNEEAAIQTEHLANQVIKMYDVDILCGYPRQHLDEEINYHIFQRICAEHSGVHLR